MRVSINIDKSTLVDLCINKELTQKKVAELLNCSRTTIQKNLRNYNMNLNTLLLEKRVNKINEQEMRSLYIDDGMDIRDIAKFYSVSTKIISKKINEYNIKRKREAHKIGEKFNKIKIINYIRTNRHGAKIWKCKCDCGHTFESSYYNLKKRKLQMCSDCSSKLMMYKNAFGDTNLKYISSIFFRQIQSSAKYRGLEFNLDIEYLENLIIQQNHRCVYSRVKIKTPRSKEIIDNAASLDRIDSSKGYIVGNVQWVHKTVNYMKMNLTNEEFKYWCITIGKNQTRKETEKYEQDW